MRSELKQTGDNRVKMNTPCQLGYTHKRTLVDRVFSRVKKAEIFLKTAIRMTTTFPRSFMPYALETAV